MQIDDVLEWFEATESHWNRVSAFLFAQKVSINKFLIRCPGWIARNMSPFLKKLYNAGDAKRCLKPYLLSRSI